MKIKLNNLSNLREMWNQSSNSTKMMNKKNWKKKRKKTKLFFNSKSVSITKIPKKNKSSFNFDDQKVVMMISFVSFKIFNKNLQKIRWQKSKSFEVYFKDFPLFRWEPSFCIASKGHACFWISCILEIIVTDGELCIAFFNVTFVNNADITTSEDGSFFRIACNGKLSQVQSKSFLHIQGKNEGFQWFISSPMLFWWIPRYRCVSSNNFIKFGFNKHHSIWYVITDFMEL